MLQAAKGFKIGRPQMVAGLMLLCFVAQCLWVGGGRKLSELEYQYIGSGLSREANPGLRSLSPLTGWVARLPIQAVRLARMVAPPRFQEMLAIPHPGLLRLPFVIFGAWLGGALWWVSRRLFDDAGGYTALALYCSSPAMVMISSNVGPEILLAWSLFGLIYTAIGVAHTLYASPRRWMPRILILGLSIGLALSTALWSFTIVLLALAFMLYLAPGRRSSVWMVLISATVIGLAIYSGFRWWAGDALGSAMQGVHPQATRALAQNLGFVLAESYSLPGLQGIRLGVLPIFFILALTIYGGWRRSRYFGNTAPLLAAFSCVLLFALVPSLRIWEASVGLSFAYVFISGVAADVLEAGFRRPCKAILAAGFLLRAILSLNALNFWIRWSGPNHL